MKFVTALLLLFALNMNAQDNYNLLIGTYTNECDSKGIYIYDFNTSSGQGKLRNTTTTKVINPSFLSVSPDKKYVYSVNEDGDKSSVSAFKYFSGVGTLDFMNKKDSKGADPCHIINDDKNIIVANYSGGSIEVFAKKADCSIGDSKQLIKHFGGSINQDRQKSAHVHMVHFSPDMKYVFVNDLGTDKIYIYNYNPLGGDKVLTLKETVSAVPGSGPRHLVFNPNGIFFYVLHELDGAIVAYSFENGKLGKLQETTVVAEGFTGVTGAADIHFSNDGKFLYATDRGDANTITTFRVHSNGLVNKVQQISTGGIAPRNFAIDPKDNFLLVANQKSNAIMIFKRDKTTGMLEDTGNRIEVCAPVCLVFTTK